MERKTLRFEFKEINEDEGTFSGYASTFTEVPDSYGDVVDRGAFKKTIRENRGRIKILWNHLVNEPIGKPLEMREDDTGLFVRGKLSLGVQRAREVLALMKDGIINEMSIGYDAITDTIVKGVRHLKEVRLYDVSPVTFAANPAAAILDVKAMARALDKNDIQPVREAVKALQALLEDYESKREPAATTPAPVPDPEAARLDALLENLDAEMKGFDERAASAAIDAAILKLN